MSDASPRPSTPLRRWAIPVSIVMLVGWGVWTYIEAPGWAHVFLTAGVFLLVWGIVARGTPDEPAATTGEAKRPR